MFDCSKERGKGDRQGEGDKKNVRKRRLQTLGDLWPQAFVSNLKTKSSGDIKTSFKNNINIFCGLYMAQYYPRHVHDTETVKPHSYIYEQLHSEQSHELYLQTTLRKLSFSIQISYAITRHLSSWNLADPHLTIDSFF